MSSLDGGSIGGRTRQLGQDKEQNTGFARTGGSPQCVHGTFGNADQFTVCARDHRTVDARFVLQSLRTMILPSKQRMGVRLLSVLLLLPLAGFAHNSTGVARPQNAGELAHAWELDLSIIIPLLLSLWLYFKGVAQLWEQTHRGCGI